MAPSWRKLHYVQRPAKNIERKMIADLLRRLDRVHPVEDWKYIGMGSVYFADFSLFHRQIGFDKMINIEKQADAPTKRRFEFNKPFGCIDLEWGTTSDVLPRLDWTTPAVVWLDYDGTLDASVLGDVGQIANSCAQPTLLIVSVNVDSTGDNADLLADLKSRVTAGKVPLDVIADDLSGWGLAAVAHRVLTAEIESAIVDRNAVSPHESAVTWRQLLNFHYADGAKMLTIGGLIHETVDTAVDEADLESLYFVRSGSEPMTIRVPNLSTKEVLHLSAQMPAGLDTIEHHGIPAAELEQFAESYRYFPAYVDADV